MKTILSLLMFISVSLIYAQIPATVDSAYMHIKEQFDRYHKNSYVYSDDNAGGNIYIPSIWQGGIEDIYINQAYTEDPVSGRSCTKIVFPLNSQICFSAIKYVYPENNIGNYEGFDISEATELSFYTKGSGIAEFILGGMNRRPFYSDTLQFQDGVDIRSSGLIELTDDWEYHTIDLTNNTFWVYKDSTEGLNNKYIQPVFMDDHEYFDFYYGADADQGDTCMKGYWFGGSSKYAGVFLFPPEGDWNSTQGYNLTGIKKIHFKAKISEVGNVKFLFGRSDDSCGHLTQTYTLSKDWQWYEWILPSYLDYSDVIGGFGFFFGYIFQRSRFCFASAFRDPFMIRNTALSRAVLLTVLFTTYGFILVQLLKGDALSTAGSIYPIGLNTIAGGFIFGFGMVFTGSCVSGCLMRMDWTLQVN